MSSLSRSLYFVCFAWCVVPAACFGGSPTIWPGDDFAFTKPAFSDWNLEENQDRLTDQVWLTRQNTEGIFNIAVESSFVRDTSPSDTEWAFLGRNGNPSDGFSAANYTALNFNTWVNMVGSNPPGTVGLPGVVHLISDNIYVDIEFTSWSQGGGGGGGFSYLRGTPSSLSADFNRDGFVDGVDFLIWQTSFPTLDGTATANTGDANGDCQVTGDDFLAWQNQFGSGGGQLAATTVPEPTTLWLLAGLGVAAVHRRRR